VDELEAVSSNVCGEALREVCDEVCVFLDGDDAASALKQRRGKSAAARADLEHSVRARERRRLNHALERAAGGEKVLSKTSRHQE
jgi:hypothetical protein